MPATPVYDNNLGGLGDMATGATPPAVVTKGALTRTVPLANRVGTATWACSQLIDGGPPAPIGNRHQNGTFTTSIWYVHLKAFSRAIDSGENLGPTTYQR